MDEEVEGSKPSRHPNTPEGVFLILLALEKFNSIGFRFVEIPKIWIKSENVVSSAGELNKAAGSPGHYC